MDENDPNEQPPICFHDGYTPESLNWRHPTICLIINGLIYLLFIIYYNYAKHGDGWYGGIGVAFIFIICLFFIIISSGIGLAQWYDIRRKNSQDSPLIQYFLLSGLSLSILIPLGFIFLNHFIRFLTGR